MHHNAYTPKSEILDSAPPHDLETERAVLGSIFFWPDALDDVMLTLDKRDFYDESHRGIYADLMEMHSAGKPIGVALYSAIAKANGTWDGPLMQEIYRSVATGAHAVLYANIVRDMAARRELRRAGEELIMISADGSIETPDAISISEQKVFAVRDRRTLAQRAISLAEASGNAIAEISARSNGTAPGLTSGFPDLDNFVQWRPGELAILAARPSMGKSALALNIACHLAAHENESVLVFSLEMSNRDLAVRVLSNWSGLDGQKLQKETLSRADNEELAKAHSKTSGVPLGIHDQPGISLRDIAALSRRQKRSTRQGLALVVVDYLQLIEPDNPRDPREQQVARISKGLKRLARELDAAVLCLAQLNRQTETASNNRPRLSHLRESGAIEQDADVVMLLHRPEYYATKEKERDELKGQAIIDVAKNRNGRTGEVRLTWLESTVTFKSAAGPMFCD